MLCYEVFYIEMPVPKQQIQILQPGQYIRSLYSMVLGSPTAGGLAGYFSAGTKNNTNHTIPARNRAFLMLLADCGKTRI